MAELGDFEWFFPFEEAGYEVAVHDNGRVAYAYLHDYSADGKIVCYTWLYNRCESPLKPDWVSRRDEPPYAVASDMVRDNFSFKVPTGDDEVSVSMFTADGELPYFAIYLNDEVLGLLEPKTHPGWSRLAKVDNPVARVITDDMWRVLNQ